MKKKTQFVHLENDSGDVNALHFAGIHGETGQQPGGGPAQGKEGRLLLLDPKTILLAKQVESTRNPVALMSLGIYDEQVGRAPRGSEPFF